MLGNLQVQDFLNELHSNSPAPGGGSVAALNGAVGASLVGMVANLTSGKKKYEDVWQEMDEIIEKMDQIKNVFVAFIDQDANSFNGVIAAFKLPKDTDEEKAARTAAIQEGYKEAISVPLTVAKSSAELFELIETVIKKGNKNAVSDGLAAAISIRSAILIALLNVEINLSAVKDEEYVKRISNDVKALKELATKKEQEILQSVTF